MESRPPSSSITKSPILATTSASASFHSHLSVATSTSQRRLRALTRPDSDEFPQMDRQKSPAILRSLPSSPETTSLPVYNSEKSNVPKSNILLRLVLIVYCSFSVILFTFYLSGIPRFLCMQKANQATFSTSPINDFPLSYRFSRILQTELRPVSFSPFIWNAYSSSHEQTITACIWIEMEDIARLESWSVAWDGPLSIVVVSKVGQNQDQKLIEEISKLPTVKNRANFHIIRKMPSDIRAANSYLNLARLFAQTRFVVLFPASPLVPIPEMFFRKLSNQVAPVNASQLASPLVLSAKLKSSSPVPFGPLSPLLVEQTYPIWCSERFFTAPSRESDWNECLWQFWLNSYGNLSSIMDRSWKFPSNTRRSSRGAPLSSEDLIHRRLSNRYRHETCVLGAKRLKDRTVTEGKVDPRKAQWLRKTCRQVMSNWGKELL